MKTFSIFELGAT